MKLFNDFRLGKYVYYSELFNEFILADERGPNREAALWISAPDGWEIKICDLEYIGEL